MRRAAAALLAGALLALAGCHPGSVTIVVTDGAITYEPGEFDTIHVRWVPTDGTNGIDPGVVTGAEVEMGTPVIRGIPWRKEGTLAFDGIFAGGGDRYCGVSAPFVARKTAEVAIPVVSVGAGTCP
jgi:hypothetical protein